jgi:DnaJ-class molecular chaperone
MARDFYEILGLTRTATQDDIRAAHRKLVRKFHPDANKHDPQADKKFQEVQEAYDTLSDPPKRRQYDQFGGRQPGPDPAWRPRHAEPPPDFDDQGDYEGMFEQLFGSKSPFGRGRRREAQDPDADVEYPITLTLAQAARGTSLPVNINRGSRTDSIEVKIPAGVKTGSRIRVRGKGARGSFGPGDLYIVVNVAEHPYFRRDGPHHRRSGDHLHPRRHQQRHENASSQPRHPSGRGDGRSTRGHQDHHAQRPTHRSTPAGRTARQASPDRSRPHLPRLKSHLTTTFPCMRGM